MRNEIIELLPELNDITDKALAGKVIDVWEEALQTGGWQPDDVKRIPFTLLVDDVPIMFIEHVRVVCQMCIKMADTMIEAYDDRVKINRDYLIAGALLADVGKLIEIEEKDGGFAFSGMYKNLRHPFTGVGIAYKHDLPAEVMHIIATHSWEGDRFKRRPESIIFHHADFTDFEIVK